MNQCKECGKGYCPNRVKRVFGHLPGYCSPQCFTASRVAMADYQKEKVRVKFESKTQAMEIVDILTAHDFIPAEFMEDPEQFAAAVELVEKQIKEKEA
jgi:hypothetical protein